jgi:glycosyltransferase involved in cell wall biosynthesis/peptidoglycan/xylan/chitin deacetylase (PgdA/CDA1 family)
MKPVIVTTSWDDGHRLDLKLASLLKKYGIKATFYISPESREFPKAQRLTEADIRGLAKDFEIGAHTLTHPHLDRLDKADARREIVGSKKTLEKIIGQSVTSFCYPYGDYSAETKRLVREAGFHRARTVTRFVTRSVDSFALGTSVDTFDHRKDGLMSVLRLCGRRPWRVFRLRRWDNLAKEMFAQARQRGEVFHLWGHSHEIEAHHDWERLEALFQWLKEQPDVVFVSNADVPAVKPRLLVTAPYFKPHSGGLEEYAYQITKGLQDDHGWEVSIVTSGEPNEPEHYSYQGLAVRRLPTQLRLSNTRFGFGWRQSLKQLIATQRPDVIVTHAPVPGMLDATASAAGKTPLFVTYHMGSMKKGYLVPDILTSSYEKFVLPLMLRKARGVIANSVFTQQTFLAQYASKTTVVTPGVNTQTFKPKAHPKAHRLMHIGGLKIGEGYKGLETSIRVVAALVKRFPDVHLEVVGNGSNQAYFEALAKKLGVDKNVTFRGRLAGNELVSAYQSASVLIAPSRKESFGMAIVEAMACGVPVVAGAVDGIPLLVRDGDSGFLVAPDNVAGFADKISKLFDDKALVKRMSQSARRRVIGDYQWTDKVAQTHELLLAMAGISLDTAASKLNGLSQRSQD